MYLLNTQQTSLLMDSTTLTVLTNESQASGRKIARPREPTREMSGLGNNGYSQSEE